MSRESNSPPVGPWIVPCRLAIGTRPDYNDLREAHLQRWDLSMLVDEVEIIVRSGTGGNGMVHFHREKYVPRGGPDGGDGGRGGDVVIQVRPGLSTLYALRHARRYVADDGRGGGPNNMSGKAAQPLIIDVPPGTVVFDALSGEQLGDLTAADDSLTVCQGRPRRTRQSALRHIAQSGAADRGEGRARPGKEASGWNSSSSPISASSAFRMRASPRSWRP